jgi:hypothetical protein
MNLTKRKILMFIFFFQIPLVKPENMKHGKN